MAWFCNVIDRLRYCKTISLTWLEFPCSSMWQEGSSPQIGNINNLFFYLVSSRATCRQSPSTFSTTFPKKGRLQAGWKLLGPVKAFREEIYHHALSNMADATSGPQMVLTSFRGIYWSSSRKVGRLENPKILSSPSGITVIYTSPLL